MQATITEWMFVCITIRTLSYPQRCSLPPFLPPLPLLPLLSLSLPIICPFFIFFFLCSLSFLCPSLSLLLLFTLALSFVFSICLLKVLSILPLIPLAPLFPLLLPLPLVPLSHLLYSLPLHSLSVSFSFPSLHSPPVVLLSFLCFNSPFSFLCTSSSSVPSPSSPSSPSTALSFHSFFCSLSFLFPICYFSFPSSSAHFFPLLPHRPLLRLLPLLQNTINRTNLSHTGCNLQTAWRNLSLSAAIRRKERG